MVQQSDFKDETAARIQAMQLVHMTTVPYIVKAAMKLGVHQMLVDAGPSSQFTAEEIARSISTVNGCSADSTNLDRLLRVLASYSIVTETVSLSAQEPRILERRYGFAPVLKYLTENEDGACLAPLIELMTDPWSIQPLHMLHAPVLDKSAEPHILAHGMNFFEYATKDPRSNALFNKAMHGHSQTFVPLLLEKYRGFEGLTSLVDVGGGLGGVLAMILSEYPNIQGINYDQPHVVVNGIQRPNLKHVGGDFFESVPEAEAVWMKWILHDWSDESCIKILINIWKALPPHGKLINMDVVLPEVSDTAERTRLNLCSNVMMMAFNNHGRERTFSELKMLAAEAGFKRVELVATVDYLSVHEFYKD